MSRLDKRINCYSPKCAYCARYYDRPTGKYYCKNHKTHYSYNFRDARCIVDDCDGWQMYNFPGGRALFCGFHKCGGMLNVRNAFKGVQCFILDCPNICHSVLPVCKNHRPKKMKNVQRYKISTAQLSKFYEKQRYESMARLKYMLNIPIDIDFILLNP